MNKFISSFFKKDPLDFLSDYPNIRLSHSISDFTESEWDSLTDDKYPFLDYQFLLALEKSGSIGKESGWLPYYLSVYNDNKQLSGVIPLYLKFNSYGEYIFDWSWASAYQRSGLNYYPKFVVSAPFTPASGKKILIKPGEDFELRAGQLIEVMLKLAESMNVSSIHWLFIQAEEQQLLVQKGFMPRFTHQFHWKNNNYSNFEDYLLEFNSKKRNQIRRERKQANEGLKIEILTAEQLKDIHWKTMFKFYQSTTSQKWGQAYLTRAFFDMIARKYNENAVMVLASRDNQYIAGALNFRKNEHLYGRYWGCLDYQQCLHFEICYYQSIDYAIENGISLFEAGAQGEHKLYRGFLPNHTYSAHWIANPVFSEAISDFLQREKASLDFLFKEYKAISPFKSEKGLKL